MRLTFLIGLLAAPLVLASPAQADACHDWWFTRNLIIDKAGYCFGSALGQAQFDNAGCVGKDVSLDPASARAVDTIRELEAEYQCRVDTSQSQLDLPDRDLRLLLDVLPIADGLESACIGYRAAPLSLRSGPSANAPVIGEIAQGVTVSYAHLPAGDWVYVTTHRPDYTLVSGGWFNEAIPEEACTAWAG